MGHRRTITAALKDCQQQNPLCYARARRSESFFFNQSTNHLRPDSESELELVLEPDPELLESSSDSEPELLLLALRREDLESTRSEPPGRLGEPGETGSVVNHMIHNLTHGFMPLPPPPPSPNNPGNTIIGASVSEPHTSEFNAAISVCLFVCLSRTSCRIYAIISIFA